MSVTAFLDSQRRRCAACARLPCVRSCLSRGSPRHPRGGALSLTNQSTDFDVL